MLTNILLVILTLIVIGTLTLNIQQIHSRRRAETRARNEDVYSKVLHLDREIKYSMINIEQIKDITTPDAYEYMQHIIGRSNWMQVREVNHQTWLAWSVSMNVPEYLLKQYLDENIKLGREINDALEKSYSNIQLFKPDPVLSLDFEKIFFPLKNAVDKHI